MFADGSPDDSPPRLRGGVGGGVFVKLERTKLERETQESFWSFTRAALPWRSRK
jgi:hypothetical protein